ncbi:hypothetical protein [Streptomyces sp. NBC_00893]|uniref:hypothetical protein n=1 Tax=Streptomyces sp. NBC_00893 TaxID=2975862 RepID=UPI0022518379|nr:hypothetical protein [Streptomyces sp. NBC_00893]MCX4844498.1 hypothetical protein [Streptomyces sp. NBC_00893]
MHVSRAELGPAAFVVDYRPVREGYESGYAGLVVRSSDTPEPRCPEPVDKSVTCTVDAHGEMVMVRVFPDGTREVTLVRRRGKAEVSVAGQSVDESGLRHLLDTLHPLSDTELGELMREKKIDHRL